MSYNLGNILTPQECEDLALEILEEKSKGVIQYETDNRYYRNSYGGITTGSWHTLRRFTPLVEEKVGKRLTEANPYCRVYNSDSTLNEHIDRPGLDWTVSLCLYNNTGQDWPLYVREDSQVISFPTLVGHGCLMNGTVYPHWREPLQCNDDQFFVMMFLHWSE